MWSVADLLKFSRLVRLMGDCFVLRRTFQRLDRDEITVAEANALLTTHLTVLGEIKRREKERADWHDASRRN